VTNDINALIARARQSADAGATPSAEDRQKLLRVAQEFESMLMTQVLKDMRQAGKWDDEESEGDEKLGFGADSLFEMADSELASHLARVQGLGLSKQLLAALDRMQGVSSPAATPAATPATGSIGFVPPTVAAALQRVPGIDAEDPTLPEATNTVAPVVTSVPHASVVPPSGVGAASGDPADDVGSPTVRTDDGRVTSNFGWRRDPFTGQARFHRGVDLAAAYGQDVQAARAGRVIFSGEQHGYGNTVVLQHADGTRSRYAHLSARVASVGDTVEAGAVVGRAGHSGRATGTHVHFEVTAADGRPVSPDAWLKGV
jgi:murein DD-endopeptidase MepM/ murein hydrolase activator NlpD